MEPEGRGRARRVEGLDEGVPVEASLGDVGLLNVRERQTYGSSNKQWREG